MAALLHTRCVKHLLAFTPTESFGLFVNASSHPALSLVSDGAKRRSPDATAARVLREAVTSGVQLHAVVMSRCYG